MPDYLKPVPPKKGYRRGFEPRSGESESQRLKRETAELLRRIENKKRYGATYDHYSDRNDNFAAGGTIDKPKPKPMPLPTSPRRVPPSLMPTKPPPKGRAIKKYAKGGSIDGCAIRGKTKGKMV